MWNRQRYCGQLQGHVWIANFRGKNWKTSTLRGFSYFFVVLRHGRSCKEMCGAILWVGKQDDSTTSTKYLLHASMTTTSKKKKQNLLENSQIHALKLFYKMFIFGTFWEIWYSMVSEKARTIHNKTDHGLWQTPESIDILHSSHMWIQTEVL